METANVLPEHGLTSSRAQGVERLTIVIPALNEEDAIADTITRCLDAAEHVVSEGQLGDLEVIVVSDGSTDRTAEIAAGFASRDARVSLIEFPQNRGYGAAIKAGFERGSGDLVGFLDADGTCDPRVFADLCRALNERDADIVLGSRMGRGSEMPLIRAIGNTIFAWVLGACSGKAVTDTASGMRVLRRSCLRRIYPLPDGLHFTPAMSARALMVDSRIVEVPMPYAERVGESKLHVIRDGVRFARSIFDALLQYRPGRLLYTMTLILMIAGAAWSLYPVEYYLRNRSLEEWMIYRVLLSSLLMTCAFVFVTAGVVADQIAELAFPGRRKTFVESALSAILNGRILVPATVASVLAAVALLWPGLLEYVVSGQVHLHWSRFIAAFFLLQSSAVAVAFLIVRRVVLLWTSERAAPC